MADEKRFSEARKHAKVKLAFHVHLVVYLVVIGALLIVNLLTGPGYYWFFWPAMGWGIALLFHGARAFLLPQKKENNVDVLARRKFDKQHSEHHLNGKVISNLIV